jgi:hypothetical protein
VDYEPEGLWPIFPPGRIYSSLQLSAPSPDGAALDVLYGDIEQEVDLLPPYTEREVDLMEVKGRFRFPSVLRHYLVKISRETNCLYFAEEFCFGDMLRTNKPFLITGRVSIKQLFGSEYRSIHLSEHEVVVVNGDRYGQVTTLLSDLKFGRKFGGSAENVANYLYRVRSNFEPEDIGDKGTDFQAFVDDNGSRCRRAGLTDFHVSDMLRGHRRTPKDIVKVLHHCKTLGKYAVLDRDRKEKAARVIQRAWWTFWLKPGRKGVANLEDRFRAFCGVGRSAV